MCLKNGHIYSQYRPQKSYNILCSERETVLIAYADTSADDDLDQTPPLRPIVLQQPGFVTRPLLPALSDFAFTMDSLPTPDMNVDSPRMSANELLSPSALSRTRSHTAHSVGFVEPPSFTQTTSHGTGVVFVTYIVPGSIFVLQVFVPSGASALFASRSMTSARQILHEITGTVPDQDTANGELSVASSMKSCQLSTADVGRQPSVLTRYR